MIFRRLLLLVIFALTSSALAQEAYLGGLGWMKNGGIVKFPGVLFVLRGKPVILYKLGRQLVASCS